MKDDDVMNCPFQKEITANSNKVGFVIIKDNLFLYSNRIGKYLTKQIRFDTIDEAVFSFLDIENADIRSYLQKDDSVVLVVGTLKHEKMNGSCLRF